MEQLDIIKEYELLKKIKPLEREDIFLNSLLRAKIEWEFDDLYACNSSITRCIEHIIINADTFPLLLSVGTLIGRFSDLIKHIGEECLKLDDSNIMNIVFKKYYETCMRKINFDVEDLFDKCTKEEKSIVLYMISTINSDKKSDFLEVSLIECEKNISSIRELYKLNYKLDISSLNYLYRVDSKLFHLNDLKSKDDESFKFTLKPFGGGGSIGASSYYIEIEDTKLIIDCGVKFENDEIVYPKFDENAEEVKGCELCIVTHAHLDHCGAILKLYEMNSSIRFIMTKGTRELLKKNLENIDKEYNFKYSLDDLHKRILILEYNKPFKWRKSDLIIELFPAGHILGASSVFLKTESAKVFVTGDYCIEDQATVKGIRVPKDEVIDILITENTYGDKGLKEIESRKMICEKFRSYVLEKIEEGKNILIPAFALGRSQELINLLKDMAEKNLFRVYVDGTAIKMTELYSDLGVKIKGRNIHYVKSDIYESKEDFIYEEVLNNKSCVITSSGMLQEGSTSATYAKCMLGMEDTVCILTGYQAGNTNGAKLREQFKLEAERYIIIEDEKINIKCELKEFHLSAHCANTEILALVKYLEAKKVILVHGEAKKEKKSEIYKLLEKNKMVDVIQSEDNVEIRL